MLAPLALIYRAWWLFVPATPLVLAGLVLFQTRLRIAAERRTAQVEVTNYLFGLKLKRRRYAPSDVLGLDVHRVAGAERERPSDTWYVRLNLRTRTYTIGRHDDRLEALEAKRELGEVLRTRPRPLTATEMQAAAEETLRGQPQSAASHYQMGLALLGSGDTTAAREAFQEALELAREPLLRRMIEQRLGELNRR